MLGSNLSSVSNQDSPNENENETSTNNNLNTPRKKDSPDKKSKESKQKSPSRNSKKVSPVKSGRESSKRLRTIESFLIASPKAKRVKSFEFNDINENSFRNKGKKLDKGKDAVIVIDDNDNNKDNDITIIDDNPKNNNKKSINSNDKKDKKKKGNSEEDIDNENDNKIKDNSNFKNKVKKDDNNSKKKKNSKNNNKDVNEIEKNKSKEIIIDDNIDEKKSIQKDENQESIITKNNINEDKSKSNVILITEDKTEEKEEEDDEFDSDTSLETLSSFTSSDLDIDPEVESRLNSQASSISVEIEENQEKDDDKNEDDKKKETTKEKKVKKGKMKSEKKSIKKLNNKKENKKESKKDKKKKEDKNEELENNKKSNKKEIKNDNKRNVEKSTDKNEVSNKTVKSTNDLTNKVKNKINVEDIPDNEIVELKNKRVIFHEKKIQIDTLSETLIELLCFHEYKNSQTEPIPKIPERFNSLIAKLVQDSDASENNLVNSVYQSLSPTDEDDESEPILLRSAVLPAIRNVSVRRNYGIEKEGAYYPNLAIWRWEVKDLNWLTKNIQEKIKLRRLKRERASQILKNIVDNMSEEERNNLFRSKKRKSIIVEENKSNDNKESNTDTENKTSNNSKSDEKNDNKKNEKNDSSTKENEKRKIDSLQGQRSIAGFFSPIKKKKIEEKSIPETIQEKQNMEFDNRFKSFYIKSNTKIAPLNYFKDIKVEYNFSDDDKMDCDEEVSLDSYLSIIRERKIQNIIKKRKEEREKQLLEKEIIDLTEDTIIPHYKMKLLQFFENHRPAYYGTWRKNTKIISGRHPFKKDTELLDYEFDSEIEWVADEEGEECLSDEEDDEEEDIVDNEQGDDDGWLVPHGYLSDDEGVEEDIDKVKLDKKNNDPKPMKVVPLIPVIIGPIYVENSYDEIPQDNVMLGQFSAQLIDSDMDLPLDPFKEYPTNDESTSNTNSTEENDKKLKIIFPEEYLSIFIKIVQYSLKGMVKIIDEAKEMEEFKNIPKIQIEKKLREIAVKEKPEGASKICWCVKDEIYKKLNITKPDIPESLKIENSVTSPKKNKTIFNKTVKSPSSEKKKQMKEPLLNFLPRKKNISVKPNNKKTESTIIIDIENEKI